LGHRHGSRRRSARQGTARRHQPQTGPAEVNECRHAQPCGSPSLAKACIPPSASGRRRALSSPWLPCSSLQRTSCAALSSALLRSLRLSLPPSLDLASLAFCPRPRSMSIRYALVSMHDRACLSDPPTRFPSHVRIPSRAPSIRALSPCLTL
jgi:hypothetical protein